MVKCPEQMPNSVIVRRGSKTSECFMQCLVHTLSTMSLFLLLCSHNCQELDPCHVRSPHLPSILTTIAGSNSITIFIVSLLLLQWFPITHEIKLQICGLVFSALHNLMPTCLLLHCPPPPPHMCARMRTHYTQRELQLWSGYLPLTSLRNYELPTSSNSCHSSETAQPPA